MTHEDHKFLLKSAVGKQDNIWLELGSGEGAFTLALRDLAGKNSKIYSVDKNKAALQIQQKRLDVMFPSSDIVYINKNMEDVSSIEKLDGILMANSLHYIKNQVNFVS